MFDEDGKKQDMMLAWNNSQAFHAHDLAKAFGHYLTMFSFEHRYSKMNDLTGESLKAVKTLEQMLGLAYILEDAGSFLLHGFMSSEQLEWCRELQLQNYAEFKKYALNFVNSLLPGDDIVDSMIAPPDGKLYESVVRQL